ncbi:unnamed protein product [Symbiodinium natans]|uniref:PBZ-type domain-containing protein n=1 Tax=Symbiodinium natans TaxID=878477 RepID=A0A812J620_9DINO|nr:unnamed protein product [Symbiodinium natans]
MSVPALAQLKNADGYEDVAARVKPSAEAAWDIPSGSLVELVEEWVECEFGKLKGFIKGKNLPAVASSSPGDLLEVRDSYAGNTETCMRRHCEQDASKGNVVCFVPNGPKAVKLVERWVECRWRGHKNFVKARHVQPAPAGTALDSDDALPAAKGRGGSPGKARGSASAAMEPPAKKAKTGAAKRPPCKYGAGCYQKNPLHRAKFSHPGDPDFKSDGPPEMPPEAAKSSDDVEMAPASASSAAASSDGASGSGAAKPDAPPEGKPAEPDADMPDAEAAAPASPAGKEKAEASPPAVPPAAPAEPPPAPPPAAPPAPAAAPPAAAPAAAPPPEGESRECQCCFDDVPATEGIVCPSKEHFFCKACMANFLTAFKTADYADQKKAKGRALCPMKDSETPFGDSVLAAVVPQDVFDEYLQIRIKVAEQSIQEHFEKENTAKIEELKDKLAKATGSSEQLELDKHRLKIIDDIFTLKCPRCKMAFLDYDNCSAITCAACKCGFCSYCLEDCGKDAHQHFYKNGSKCPNEGGPLFIAYNLWQEFQNNRKERLLCEFLAGLPEDVRKKVADLVSPDAKDLGIKMPEDLSAASLVPEAHGFQRLKITVPRRLRRLLVDLKKELPEKVELTVPDPKEQVSTMHVSAAMKAITAGKPAAFAKKNIAAHLPASHKVKIDDEWVLCRGPKKSAVAPGFIKAKHLKTLLGNKGKLEEANGHGSVLVREKAVQDEDDNSLGYLDDGTDVEVMGHWYECTWEGVGPSKRGFVHVSVIPDNDISMRGPTEDCTEALKFLEGKLGIKIETLSLGGGKPKAAAKAKAKAKGKAKAKAKAA